MKKLSLSILWVILRIFAKQVKTPVGDSLHHSIDVNFEEHYWADLFDNRDVQPPGSAVLCVVLQLSAGFIAMCNVVMDQ